MWWKKCTIENTILSLNGTVPELRLVHNGLSISTDGNIIHQFAYLGYSNVKLSLKFKFTCKMAIQAIANAEWFQN